VHAEATAPSREQRYDSTSVEELENVMDAVVLFVGDVGCETVGALGAVWSTVHDRVDALLGL
jgi:hypothetical protein